MHRFYQGPLLHVNSCPASVKRAPSARAIAFSCRMG